MFVYVAISYNQPKLCPFASWYPRPVVIANASIIGTNPFGIFVDRNNLVYAVSRATSNIFVWSSISNTAVKMINVSFQNPFGIFVTDTGDVFVGYDDPFGQVSMWPPNASTSVSVMNASKACYGLFVDNNNTLYCSVRDLHQVLKKSLNNRSDPVTKIAGTGCAGPTSDMLNGPYGVFVDVQYNLYVADCSNDRVQRFGFQQSNGTTIAGHGAPNTIVLDCPTGIVLDADGYFFISENYNNRLIASGPTGFRCILGCANISGSGMKYFTSPQSLSFDSQGNIFVTSWNDNQVLKFMLATNSCSKYVRKNIRQKR